MMSRHTLHPPRSLPGRVLRACCIVATLTPALLSAQMGGMGGGMGGGGMGRRGGMGAPGMSTPRRENPAERAKENLKSNDALALMLDNKKVLKLSKMQEDTLKAFHKEMKERQEPLFKNLDKMFSSNQNAANGQGGGMDGGPGGMGGMGGGMGGMGGGMGGGRSGGRSGRGESPDSTEGGRGPGAALPDTAKKIMDRLVDIQDAYRDRALTKLDNTQRAQVDSLHNVQIAKEREKAEKERAEMEKRRRG